MELIVQQLYLATFNNLTANGEEFPPGFVLPWVHKGRFVRVPRYQDEFSTFGPAVGFVKRNGNIVAINSFGHRKVFRDPELAGAYLAEV